jgi:hypothetical protein
MQGCSRPLVSLRHFIGLISCLYFPVKLFLLSIF